MGEGELRISRDPAHLGQYQIEIETELATDVELIEAALRSARYGVVDFDPWGRTYLSVDDPYLEVDVDALSDYGDRSRLRMRRSKISEHQGESRLRLPPRLVR